jgi:hypothetical protein
MRAVWSFWSTPFTRGCGWGWREPLHHLLAWGLSLRLARTHYPDTTLVTDSHGQALLVDALGLRFRTVSTALDALGDADPQLWALGKLLTYSLQEDPFVHLDADVFLWRALPGRLTGAPVLAQHPERWRVGAPWGDAGLIERAFAGARVDLPEEWRWARARWGELLLECNTGIVGGTNVEFIRYYAGLVLDLALSPHAQAAWAAIPARETLTPLIEQFMLSACLDFHRTRPESPFRGVHARYLFPSGEMAFDPRHAARFGYTHLLADAKHDGRIMRRLEQRVRDEDPALYARCLEVAAGRLGC